MRRTWSRISMIAAAVFTLCLTVVWPSAAAAEVYLAEQPFVDQSTNLVAEYGGTENAAVHSEIKGFLRLPEAPGGVCAKVTNSTKVTDNVKEVLPGGAAGVAGIGIRGPTTS